MMHRACSPTLFVSHGKTRRGFSLVELIVVIGIIVLLAALTIAVGPTVFGKSDVRQTESTLTLLDQAFSEWHTRAGRMLTWGVDGQPIVTAEFDIQADATPAQQLVQALNRIQRDETVRSILAQINPNFLKGDLGTGEITGLVDPWDNDIIMVHSGMVRSDFEKLYGPSPGVMTDTDGTVYVDDVLATILGLDSATQAWEQIYGRCKSRRILFISAGPDGRFGSRAPAAAQLEKDRAADNIFSYPPELSE